MICEQTGCCVIMRAIVMYTMAIYSTAVRGVGISKLHQEIYGARQNNRSRSLFSYRFFKGLQGTHFADRSAIAEICMLLLFRNFLKGV